MGNTVRILYAIKRSGVFLDNLADEPVAALEDLYRQGNAWVKEDEKALQEARQELVKLQDGDNEIQFWQKIRDLSLGSFEEVYELNVNFDYAP